MTHRFNGFTLVEMLVVVMVMAIALGIAAPSFAALAERNRALAVFHQLTATLAGARLAAVQLGRPVTICPTRDGRQCRQDLVWDEGWMSYIDVRRADQPANVGTVIRHVELSGRGIAVRSSVGRHRIRFQPSGWASGANISLRLCSQRAQRLLGAVIVNNAGRPRSERQDAAEGSCPYVP